MISDYGLFLEGIGFVLMVLFWKVPTHKDRDNWIKLFKKISFLSRSDYKWRDLNPSRFIGHHYEPNEGPKVPKSFAIFWQYGRFVGLSLVLSGLALQHSWFVNNLPQL